jgi:hypothetical protein
LRSGKIFWYSRKRNVAEREEKHNEVEERDTSVILQIIGIPFIEEKEKYRQLSSIEEDPLHPTQARLCIEPTTLCASPRTEVRSEIPSLVVSEGSKDISKGSYSSGNNMPSHNQLVSPGNNTTQYMMERVYPTLRMHVFHRVCSKDTKHCLFFCEVIWIVKNF